MSTVPEHTNTLDVATVISDQISACHEELAMIGNRINFLVGKSANTETVKSFEVMRDDCVNYLRLCAVHLCSAVDKSNRDGRYDDVIVERDEGGKEYTWYIVLKRNVNYKIRIEKIYGALPRVYSIVSETFLKYLHSEKVISYHVTKIFAEDSFRC